MAKASAQVMALLSIAGVYAAPSTLSKRAGLAATPPMGWDSYNHYSCSPSQGIIESNAQALVDLGLDTLGYHYAIIDCGWTVPNRTADGKMTWSVERFPDGFPALGKFIHDLGLGFGVYSDAGVQTCMVGNPSQTGSLGHENVDAATFAEWGADLLKYDNCYSSADKGYPDTDYAPTKPPQPRFDAMKTALGATGREIMYQLCEWGIDFPSAWAGSVGQSWRITNDIQPKWSSIFRILNQFVPSASAAGPGHWPDLDMLEVGNDVLTEAEEQTHMALWAIAKSPLIIGGRLKDADGEISKSSLAILSNKNVIGYNQDSMGTAANLTRRYTMEGFDVWAGPLSGGRTITALINWNNAPVDATLNLPDVGLQSAASALDVWANKPITNIKTSYTANVAAHGTLLLELSETTPSGTYSAAMHQSSAGSAVVYSDIYAQGDSAGYTVEVNTEDTASTAEITLTPSSTREGIKASFAKGVARVEGVTFKAGNNNTVNIQGAGKLTGITVIPPAGDFYSAKDFTPAGGAKHYDCTSGLCAPVGAKIVDIGPTGTATISIPAKGAGLSNRYVELTYINNDVAMQSAWTTGTNSRNITIAVNGADPVRLETPLSGRSSELYSVMKGWGDSATLGLLVDGFGTGEGGKDTIVVSNVNGDAGVQELGADFVGLKVY